MKRIALLGECMIELNGKPFGDMQQAFGGDTLNTAIYLARASQRTDIQVHYLTAMGQDPLSQQIIARWQQAGIDTSAVLIDEQRHPGLYLIQLDEQGGFRVVVVVARFLQALPISFPSAADLASWLHSEISQ